MDFSPYQNKGQLTTPNADLQRNGYSNAGELALAQQQGGTGKAFSVGISLLQDQLQTSKVMEANNELNALNGELMAKIRENQEGNALNSVADYEEGYRKNREKIRAKHGKYLHGRAGQAYNNMADKDFNTGMNAVRSYQYEQMERYKDSQLANGLSSAEKIALDGYKDPMIVADMLGGKIPSLVAARYFNYGPERIDEETRKAQAAAMGVLMNGAVQEENWGTANELLNRYGGLMRPEQRPNFAKLVGAQLKKNRELTLFDGRYATHGGSLDDFLAAAEANFAGVNGYDADKAVKAAKADIGKEFGTNTCTISLNKWMTSGGGKERSVWAPTSWNELPKNNKYGPEAVSQLRHGDIVFWDANKEGEPDHVGIYDATTGKVIQSGTHGVNYLDLDFYKLVGFSHPEGTGAAATPAEREEYKKAAIDYFNKQKGIENTISADHIDRGRDAIEEAILHGNDSESALRSLAIQYSTNSDGSMDEKAARKLNLLVDRRLLGARMSAAGAGGGSRGGTGTSVAGGRGVSDIFVEDNLTADLLGGRTTTGELWDYILDNPEGWDDTTRKKAMAVYHAAKDGKGVFGLKLEPLKEEIMKVWKGPASEQAMMWEATKDLLIKDVLKARADHENISMAWLIEKGQKNLMNSIPYMTKGWFGTVNNKAMSRAKAYAKGYEIKPSPDSDGIVFKGISNNAVFVKTGDELEDFRKDEKL